MKRLLFVVMILVCFMIVAKAEAYQYVNGLSLPITGFAPDECLDWGDTNSVFKDLLGRLEPHVADDYCTQRGTPVKAVANGKVMFIDNNRGVCQNNWIAIIVVEHQFVNGQKFCSIYGHTRSVASIAAGQEVVAGQVIGEVVDYSPCSSNHLHLGVHIGSYGAVVGQYASWIAGYLSVDDWPGQYASPYPFMLGVGLFSDGWIDNQCPGSQPFLDAYLEQGGYAKLGIPFSDQEGSEYVHEWWGVYLQNFKSTPHYYGTDGQTALIYNPEKDKAFLVKEGFWGAYKWLNFQEQYQGRLGYPLGNETQDGNGSIQYFSGGTLIWNQSDPNVIYFQFNDGTQNQVDVALNQITIASIPTSDDGTSGGNPEHYNWPCIEPETNINFNPLDYLNGGMIINSGMDFCHNYGYTSMYCYDYSRTVPYSFNVECNNGWFTFGDDNCVLTFFNRPIYDNPPIDRYRAGFAALVDSQTLSVVANQSYLVSFVARSEVINGVYPMPLSVVLVDKDYYRGPYPCIQQGLVGSVSTPVEIGISDEWQSYAFYIEATATNPDVALRFFMGDSYAAIWIDDVYMAKVEPKDLLAYYPMQNDGSDISGNANYGYNYRASFTPGLVGNAMTLTSSMINPLIDVPWVLTHEPSSQMTVSAWIYPTKLNNACIMDHTGRYCLATPVALDGDGILNDWQALMFNRSVQPYTVTAKDVLTLNEWQNLVMTYDGSTITLYYNGEEVATGAANGLVRDYALLTLTIGYDRSRGEAMEGQIDEIKVYSEALTADEVMAEYNEISP